MIDCQKDLFTLPSDIHYLNCATLGPLNKLSELEGYHAIQRSVNPVMRTRDQFFDPVETSKALFAQLINANSDHIAIIPSVSYGIAIAANNIDLEQKEEVVILEDQFPSNYYIWKQKCERANALLKIVSAPNTPNKSEAWTNDILNAINDKTKVVAMGNVHWMDGTHFDLKAIGERCREFGTYLIIDGTQSVGALPFDVAEVQPDVLVVASYKWLLGAYGVGFGYFSNRMFAGDPLEINWINKVRSNEFENLTSYLEADRPGAAKFSMGEQSNFISIAMVNEALKLLNEWQPQNIQEYTKALTTAAWDELSKAGITIDPTKKSYHMTGLRFGKEWDMDALQNALKQNQVIVSQRGSALRISVNVYNEMKDIEALVNIILEHRPS